MKKTALGTLSGAIFAFSCLFLCRAEVEVMADVPRDAMHGNPLVLYGAIGSMLIALGVAAFVFRKK